jgi:hypothetical protein
MAKIALEKNSIELCERIVEVDDRNYFCYQGFAEKLNDIAICDRILEEADRSYCRDSFI